MSSPLSRFRFRVSGFLCALALLGSANAQQTTVLYDVATNEQKRPTFAQTLANATNQAALLAVAQPLDSDLTAIAALSTTTFGRSLLTLSSISNSALTNSAITIAGTSTALGGTITLDTITGLASTGLIKRTAANTLGIAGAATDYVAPSAYASANGLTLATARLLGRTTAATGAAEEISVASAGLSLSAGVLSLNTTITQNTTFQANLTVQRASGAQSTLVLSSSGAVDAVSTIDADSGQTRRLQFRTGTSVRWAWLAGGAAESGGNAGTNLTLTAYDDAAGAIDSPISIVRAATGAMTITRPLAGTDATDAISTTAAAFKTAGGLAVTKKLFVGTSISIGTNQVVGARITGYTAMTGTPDKATAYATSTVTLAQLAGRVMQLQADLTTHGLIGP